MSLSNDWRPGVPRLIINDVDDDDGDDYSPWQLYSTLRFAKCITSTILFKLYNTPDTAAIVMAIMWWKSPA